MGEPNLKYSSPNLKYAAQNNCIFDIVWPNGMFLIELFNKEIITIAINN